MGSTTERNAELNGLLIDLDRSLLQYVGEAWPWVGAGAESQQQTIDNLVARQQECAAALTQLLDGRDWPVDRGSYPTEYTDLHYVGLDYLLSELVTHETGVLNEVRSVRSMCSGDETASALLDQIAESQQDIVDSLKKLVASENNTSPAG